MYTDGAQTTGHHRFLQHINTSAPCPCQHCVHYEQPAYSHHGGLGYPHHLHQQQQHRPASARHTDHPSLDLRRDTQAPPAKDAVGRAFLVDRVERSGHRSPQRRPVFSLRSDDLSQVCPWELNPAQWSYAPEPGLRHYAPVREQCGCVTHGDAARAQPFGHGIPHPLPHLQVKGQGYRHRRTVRYISVDEEEEETCGCASEYYHSDPHALHVGHLQKPNGHCGGARPPVFFEAGEEGDRHQDRLRQGGSEEFCNGRSDPHKAFFPTEVPQKHLTQSRQKGPYAPPIGITGPEPSRSTAGEDGGHRRQAAAEAARQKRRQETVRDQIRQVVTDLEDVLGGLKQVHVEMKEVVEQIDRLTASIDLSEEPPCITQGSYTNSYGPGHQGDLRLALPSNHKPPPPSQGPQLVDEDRIILRTNSPSPIHMASVVKTSRFTPPVITKDSSQERTGMNGHPPQLCPPRDSNHVGHTHPEPHPQSLDPKVIINNSTSNSRTQKPPLYPQNGRCGKGSYPPSKPARTPAYPGRARHNTSMV